jgi:1-acyl-sn-glycerol-3-phosphate acyltransferase
MLQLLSYYWYRLVQNLVWVGNKLYFRLRSSGTESLPMTGPLVIVCNHQSNWDPPLVGTCSPRVLNYLAKEDLFRFAPLGWLIRSFNGIPLDRDGGGLAGIKETLKRLKRGEAILIFPEGTRSPDGTLQPIKPGFLTLVRRTGAAIQTVGLDGMYQSWPRKNLLPRPGRVFVHFGRVLTPDEIAALNDEDLTALVQQEIANGCDHAREELGS